MKCDAGEIACAIDRLTDAVSGTPGVTWFDWLSRVVIPVFLGLVTTGVALLSLHLARQSNALVRQTKADEQQAVKFRERVELGTQLSELLEALRAEKVGPVQVPSAQELQAVLGRRIPLVDQPGAEDIFEEVRFAYAGTSIDGRYQHRLLAMQKAGVSYAIRAWVRDPKEYAEYSLRRTEYDRIVDAGGVIEPNLDAKPPHRR